MPPKRDLNKASFENSDFPILCETCLGPSPYLRITKQDYGQECKICTRPFTVFRWNPGSGARFKKTEVCQSCAKIKNVCQTCLLDLVYELPVQVRDTALGRLEGAPSTDINRQYYIQNLENSGALDNAAKGVAAYGGGKSDSAAKELLKSLARQTPDYKRNRPHLCSFFAKGECSRGDACPYRHELPQANAMPSQTIQERYAGTSDAVGRAILAKAASSKGLTPPEDTSVMSLYLTSLPEAGQVSTDLSSALKTWFLEHTSGLAPASIKSVTVVEASHCAFVNFTSRQAAESAAATAGTIGITLEGRPISIAWGRSRAKRAPAIAA
ncbi:uncharacterized protein L969DRAFT_90983 [Mixia osmundae IAM 14324]|uniref:C3H1-type domain-containing protein n=1 Tax=Mixia osmundae (strain CBS 9802 / IAM 14324 / JCM 22182 / KY 12970) TaxID=764103 RepID=G7DV39_MIXOS|nr:uncharacterized protein L969DRAFT_90983 [Mixia osmundae IAM 14324]KEI36334.1 hypothetical protein L969DRAFT_90983 [Mixia osmundae IAM 14324]GAA94449.1 hypothetical protein E5Q_01101 [Mixia osmundae IAM 14324]